MLLAKTRVDVPELTYTDEGKVFFSNKIRDTFSSTNPKANPGYPWAMHCDSNKQVFTEYGPQVVERVLERILCLINGVTHTARESLFENAGANPVRVFIKDEPHPRRKFESKRYRLIANVALEDVIVERVGSNYLNKREIFLHRSHGSRPGMGLEDEDFEALLSYVANKAEGRPVVSADISGFDWSVQEWQMRWDACRRIKQMNLPFDGPWARLLMGRAHALINAVLATSDGKTFTVDIPGNQLSGSFNTSSGNSAIRRLIAYLAGALWAAANGDDCMEQGSDPDEYARLGHPLRVFEESENLEFCSQYFSTGKPIPNAPGKTLFRYFTCEERDEERTKQMLTYFRHHPLLPILEDLVL